MKRCRGTINKIKSLKPSREWEVNFRRIEYLFTIFANPDPFPSKTNNVPVCSEFGNFVITLIVIQLPR